MEFQLRQGGRAACDFLSDLAFMSAGAYRPRWFMHFAHQDEREAAQAADDLRAKRWVPVHCSAPGCPCPCCSAWPPS